MSNNLKENQLIAIELLSAGVSSVIVSEKLDIRQETLSRWRGNESFKKALENKVKINCSLIEKQFLKLFHLSLNALERVLTDNKIKSVAKANVAMKFITYFSNDELLKKKFVMSDKENHNNVSEMFDLIDQIYQKGKSDGKTEKESPK